MKKLELTNSVVEVPEGYNDIVLKDFLQIQHYSEDSSLTAVKSLIELLVKDIDLSKMPMEDFITLSIYIGEILKESPTAMEHETIDCNGKQYFVKKVEELSAREYIDFDTLSTSDDNWTSNLPLLLALITEEKGKKVKDYVKDLKKRAEFFSENLDSKTACEMILFFSNKFITYAKDTNLSSILTPQQVEQVKKVLGCKD